MEKYFIVTEGAQLHKDWFNFLENRKEVRNFVSDFFNSFNITATRYIATDSDLSIEINEKDMENHEKCLATCPYDGEFKKFRTNSAIGKEWKKRLKADDLKIQQKPSPVWYMRTNGGRFRTRLFDQNGTLYCYIEASEIHASEGFEEIKASEFMKVLESVEETKSA